MDPRPHHFAFKRELCDAFLGDPNHFFTSSRGGPDGANAYLKGIWMFAGNQNPPAIDPAGLGLVKHIKRPDVEVSVVALPKAEAPNEAYFVATTMKGSEHAIFVYERDIMGEAVLIKTHATGRANLGFHKDITLDGFLQQLESKLGVPLRDAAKPAARAPDALGLPAFQGPSAFDLAEQEAARATPPAQAAPPPVAAPSPACRIAAARRADGVTRRCFGARDDRTRHGRRRCPGPSSRIRHPRPPICFSGGFSRTWLRTTSTRSTSSCGARARAPTRSLAQLT